MKKRIKELADPVVIIADVMNRKRMNETIKILMYEANKSVNPGAWTLADFSEKFAELIVKECAGLVDHVIMEDGTRRSDFIRKHFGVEE